MVRSAASSPTTGYSALSTRHSALFEALWEIMDTAFFDELERTLVAEGPEAAIERLCASLRHTKDYANLFYALLLKKRHELGVSPVPTEAAQSLPEHLHAPYEDAIRDAGRLVGNLYLEE